ncbi:MAG: hypothetical protein FH756_02245 [Firmicutes bacterium]|nr:hypothetical protein [Bacillota bacterium]
MAKKKNNRGFSEEEKALVAHLKEKMKERGVNKFPRDWHLKQLSVARNMLAGENAPEVEQWEACIDWLFKDRYWKDKVDHLARVEALWPKYVLKGGVNSGGTSKRSTPQRGSYGGSLYDEGLPL